MIPGHGPVSDRAGILKWRADVVKTVERVRSLVKAGKPKEDVVKALVEEFKVLSVSEQEMLGELCKKLGKGRKSA